MARILVSLRSGNLFGTWVASEGLIIAMGQEAKGDNRDIFSNVPKIMVYACSN